MTPRTKRRWLDWAVGMVTYIALWHSGAGYWALLIFPFGMWNYYDGMTRMKLPGDHAPLKPGDWIDP